MQKEAILENINIHIGERLKEIRKSLGFDTQSKFAEILNILNQTYSRYEKGERDLPDNVKIRLQQKGIDINWLLTGEGEMFLTRADAPAVQSVKIPLLRQSVSCGPGQEWQSEDNIEEFIDGIDVFPALRKKNVYAFRARGISMEGLGIHDGDILFFDGSRDQKARDDVYVFGVSGETYCKLLRFEPLKNAVYVFSCQSRDIRDAELIKTISADAEDFQIFGRVLCWMHENRIMSR